MKQNRESLKRIRGIRPTIAELSLIDIRRTYRAIRKRYFREGQLPEAENVFILFVKRERFKAFVGDTECPYGCYIGDGCEFFGTILLADDMDEVQNHMTLIHEMAHMAVDSKFKRSMFHGKHWKAEMRRLAAEGAFDYDW